MWWRLAEPFVYVLPCAGCWYVVVRCYYSYRDNKETSDE